MHSFTRILPVQSVRLAVIMAVAALAGFFLISLIPTTVSAVAPFSYSIKITSVTNIGNTLTISGPVDVVNSVGNADHQFVKFDWGDGTVEVFQANDLTVFPAYVLNGDDFTIHNYTRAHPYSSSGDHTATVKVYHGQASGNEGSASELATASTENTLARCTDGQDNDNDGLIDAQDPDCAIFQNHAPVLDSIGNKSVNEETALTFTVSATDADANTLSYSLVGAPAGTSIDASTGVFNWTPTEAQGPGSYTFDVRVSDGSLTDSETITVTVAEVNLAPTLTAIGAQSVNEASPLSFTTTASDPDLPPNVLAYSASGLPTGATFNVGTRIFAWTPTYNDAGTYTVHFEVTDGALTDSEDVSITVNNVNRTPVLDPIGNQTATEGSPLQFTISGNDPDGGALTFSALNLTTGALFDALTRMFSWTPSLSQAGNYSVTFKVSDGSLEDSEIVPIDVGNVNQTPNLGQIGDKTAPEMVALSFTAAATDADGDPVTYSLLGEPSSATIDSSTGVFSWTPTETQGPGTYTFDVKASDGSATDSETITVIVTEVIRR